MQLTGKQIIEQKIVTNYCEAGIQQQGVDVRIKALWRVDSSGKRIPCIPAEGKTTFLPEKYQMTARGGSFQLIAGCYYEVELMEGVNIPANCSLHFKTRSSLVRCGAQVYSGQFDAGFKTDNAGCFIHSLIDIKIEYGARIAQAICFESDPVENLYDGQWQNDKQRNK